VQKCPLNMAKKLEAESFRFDEEKVKSEKRKKGRGERKKKGVLGT